MPKWYTKLSPALRYELLGLLLVTMGALSIISLIGLNTGPVGLFITKILKNIFGAIGAPVIPLVFVVVGSRYIWTTKKIHFSTKFCGFILLYLLLLTIYHHLIIPVGREILPENLVNGGGFTGGFILFSLRKLFGVDGTLIVLFASLIGALVMATSWSLGKTLLFAKDKTVSGINDVYQTAASCKAKYRNSDSIIEDDYQPEVKKQTIFDQERFTDYQMKQPQEIDSSIEVAAAQSSNEVSYNNLPVTDNMYHFPPLSLLAKPVKVKNTKSEKEVAEKAHILEGTLKDFGISAKIIHATQGPAVTRYELEPAAGVKVSKIVNLADDLALKLASSGIRIEAPIPGKAAIGIEVPNKHIASVPLRDVLDTQEFQKAASTLTVALGKDIAGKPILADLGKMPHLLVAGATGSGKSVCINTIICSILFKALPSQVKFVLVDPKVVELSNYNDIPHLLVPVVTDAKQASSALHWSVQEMERRYSLFAAAGVRDLSRYNESVEEPLPYIVIIIDELADLMMVAPVDVEDAICRLAQKARAAGIHLVLATQRPSVDVITGIIKANIPSRISFAVSSQIDSRTILDTAGAEKLLGKGDMLFYPVGCPKPQRVQGAFIADQEVEELVAYIKQQAQPSYKEGVTTCKSEQQQQAPESYEDELLEDAVRLILEVGQASVSMLQRKFRIGYSRAARLIDTMEEMKIVGPNAGSKPREILMTSEQVFTRYFKK